MDQMTEKRLIKETYQHLARIKEILLQVEADLTKKYGKKAA